MTENTDPNSSENRASTKTDTAADSFDDLRQQFEDECVLHGLSRAREIDPDNPPTVYFLDENSGRVYRVLDATRGSPDSGWFVIALAGPHADDEYERQLRVHDSDTHRVLIGDDLEHYAYDEMTPADDIITTSEGTFILRMGEPPIPIGDHSQEDVEE